MYQRILVPLDGSSTAERALQQAISLAAEQKASLVLLHVMNDYPLMVEMAAVIDFQSNRQELLAFADQLLAKAVAAASEAGVRTERVMREIQGGSAADTIVEEARTHGCDLIVMGTHGRRGLARLTLGSVAELVIRQTTVPVLLIRQQPAASANL